MGGESFPVGFSSAHSLETKNFFSEGEQRLVKLLNRKGRKGSPQVTIRILYLAHETEKDARPVGKELSEADVFIPEGAGWDEYHLNKLRAVAQGERVPERQQAHLFMGGLEKFVYNSKRPIAFIDVPRFHPITEDFKKKERNFYKLNLRGDFDENLKRVKEYCGQDSFIQREREEYMISQLEPTIRRLLRDNPELRKKKRFEFF